MNSSSVPAKRDQTLRSAARSTWARRIWRGLSATAVCVVVQPGQVAQDHRGPGHPGHRVQRGEVEHELEVAVAALPRADGVAVDGVHVDVDGEQVVAALGAVLEHGVEEELGVDPLALQPALHVGEGHDDGVDVPVAHLAAQAGRR